MNMKKFKNLKKFRQEYDLTQEEVGEILNITKQSVWALEKKDEVPAKYKKILEEKYDCQFVTEIDTNSNIEIAEEEDCINLTVRGNVSASMGYGVTVNDESQTGTCSVNRKFLKDIGANIDKTERIFAHGDSMEPTIQGGDRLLVDLSKKDIHDGKVYCIRFEGELYAKRLQLLPPNIVRVISDNYQKYNSFEVDFSKELDFDFEVVGEILYWGRIAR